METGTTVSSPYKKKDIDLLERHEIISLVSWPCVVQALVMSLFLAELRNAELPSLFSGKKRNDIVMAFKILTGGASHC